MFISLQCWILLVLPTNRIIGSLYTDGLWGGIINVISRDIMEMTDLMITFTVSHVIMGKSKR
jgi:hypothetical protein